MTFMMNEDKDLQKKYGKNNPFTVPENYFGDFAEKLMQQLPEKETAAPQTISLWDRVKPWIYMAAMFGGLICTTHIFVGDYKSQQTNEAEPNAISISELPDEVIDPILNQTMMDDYELYKYLTNVSTTSYNP